MNQTNAILNFQFSPVCNNDWQAKTALTCNDVNCCLKRNISHAHICFIEDRDWKYFHWCIYFHQHIPVNKISFVNLWLSGIYPILYWIVAKLMLHWSDISSSVKFIIFLFIFSFYEITMSQHRKWFSSVSILIILFVFFANDTVMSSENVTDRNLMDIWSTLLEQYTIE